jgi:RNA polymerase sigma-70 factor, ECF subfamily
MMCTVALAAGRLAGDDVQTEDLGQLGGGVRFGAPAARDGPSTNPQRALRRTTGVRRNAFRRYRVEARSPSGSDTEADPLGDLLRRAGRGDESAFGELYDALSALLYGTILKVVRNPSQSEEVTQEAFVELWRLAPRYDSSRGTVRAWATTVAHRRAVDRVRSEQASRSRSDREAAQREVEQHAHDVADHVIADMEATRVRKALDRLTAIQRQAVELAYFGGHSYREVAVLIDVPEGTIKTRIRDGMIRLRDELGVAT